MRWIYKRGINYLIILESEREREGTRREERERGIGAGERGKPGGDSTLERRT